MKFHETGVEYNFQALQCPARELIESLFQIPAVKRIIKRAADDVACAISSETLELRISDELTFTCRDGSTSFRLKKENGDFGFLSCSLNEVLLKCVFMAILNEQSPSIREVLEHSLPQRLEIDFPEASDISAKKYPNSNWISNTDHRAAADDFFNSQITEIVAEFPAKNLHAEAVNKVWGTYELYDSFGPMLDQKQTYKIVSEGSFYRGEWWGGMRDGIGEYVANDGSYYIGEWRKDKMQGKGRWISASGNLYEGEWQQGQKHGQGKFIQNSTGTIYIGEWRENLRHGFGKEHLLNGNSYEGEYLNGNKNGKGRLIVTNEFYYEGEFNNNNMEGKGVCNFEDGSTYEGDWQNNFMHGRGIYKWVDGAKYEGEFQYCKRHGKGSFVAEKICITGHWISDKPNGKCDLSDPTNNGNRTCFWIESNWLF